MIGRKRLAVHQTGGLLLRRLRDFDSEAVRATGCGPDSERDLLETGGSLRFNGRICARLARPGSEGKRKQHRGCGEPQPSTARSATAVCPLRPSAIRASARWPGSSSVSPERRTVSMCRKMSAAGSVARLTKP